MTYLKRLLDKMVRKASSMQMAARKPHSMRLMEHTAPQAKAYPKALGGKKEARGQYLTRIRRTALRLPKVFITKNTGDMHRRCKRLLAAKGGFIEEDGQ